MSQEARETAYRWNDHRNDDGDWCPWSLVSAPERLFGADDDRCPAGCRAAAVEEAEEGTVVAYDPVTGKNRIEPDLPVEDRAADVWEEEP